MKTSFPYIFSFRTIGICFNFINTQKYCQYSVKSLWIICKLNEDRAMTQIVLKLENCIINELYSILRDKLYSSNIHCQFPPYVIIYLNKNTICKRKHNKMISSEICPWGRDSKFRNRIRYSTPLVVRETQHKYWPNSKLQCRHYRTE